MRGLQGRSPVRGQSFVKLLGLRARHDRGRTQPAPLSRAARRSAGACSRPRPHENELLIFIHVSGWLRRARRSQWLQRRPFFICARLWVPNGRTGLARPSNADASSRGSCSLWTPSSQAIPANEGVVVARDLNLPVVAGRGPAPPSPILQERFQSVISQVKMRPGAPFPRARRRARTRTSQPPPPSALRSSSCSASSASGAPWTTTWPT